MAEIDSGQSAVFNGSSSFIDTGFKFTPNLMSFTCWVRPYGPGSSAPGTLFGARLGPADDYRGIQFGVQQGWALFYGGTSLIIMVGVAIDTIQQINSYLLNSHYDGLMKSGNSNRKSLK